jgi:hypothetical protein
VLLAVPLIVLTSTLVDVLYVQALLEAPAGAARARQPAARVETQSRKAAA